MNLTTQLTLLGTAAAAAGAWLTGGPVGAGILAGFLAGAATAGVSALIQRRVARRAPQWVFHAVFASFLFKALALLSAALLLRFVPALAGAVDLLSFLLAFAGAVLLILAPATVDTLRALPLERPLDRKGAKLG